MWIERTYWSNIPLAEYIQKFDTDDVSVEVRCDGLEAINATKRWNFKLSTNNSHFNLSSVLHHLMRGNNNQPRFDHIRGNQDIPGQRLDQWTRINVIVDSLSKIALWKFVVSQSSTPIITSKENLTNGVQITENSVIRSNLKIEMKYQLVKIDILKFAKKGKLQFALTEKCNENLEVFHCLVSNTKLIAVRQLIKCHSGFYSTVEILIR